MGIVRQTNSVKTLLEVFEENEHALSRVDLVNRFQEQMNKSTVYRILQRLQKEGILHSFKDKRGLHWYAKHKRVSLDDNYFRPYFQCVECGKTELLNTKVPFPEVPNHQVDRVQMFLTGQCRDCNS